MRDQSVEPPSDHLTSSPFPLFTSSPPSDPPAPPPPPNPLLDHIIAGSLGPLSRLRDSIDLTLDQISEWIALPENRRQVTNLITLLDAQTQLIICQHRLVAVAKLSEVAMNAPSPETVRRACADLLKIRLIEPYNPTKHGEPPRPVLPHPNEEMILAALQKLGEKSNPNRFSDQSPYQPEAHSYQPEAPNGGARESFTPPTLNGRPPTTKHYS